MNANDGKGCARSSLRHIVYFEDWQLSLPLKSLTPLAANLYQTSISMSHWSSEGTDYSN